MTTLLLTFVSATTTFDLPKGLLSALCYVESHHSPTAMHMDDGGSPSIGVCQLKLNTARLMGFKGTVEQLKNPKINIYYAAKYLKYQLSRYQNNTTKAVAAYNTGTYKTKPNGLVVNTRYVAMVQKAWKEKR